MGIGGISIWQLVIVLVIVLLLFGTKKLKNIGADLGGAVKGFRSAMTDSEKNKDAKADPESDGDPKQIGDAKVDKVADGEVSRSNDKSKV